VLVSLFDSDSLAGKDLAEIDFAAIEADAAASGDGLVVERIGAENEQHFSACDNAQIETPPAFWG